MLNQAGKARPGINQSTETLHTLGRICSFGPVFSLDRYHESGPNCDPHLSLSMPLNAQHRRNAMTAKPGIIVAVDLIAV